MSVTIKLRRGSAAEWTSANPVLESGEVGIELDTNKIKIGNGSTQWSSLDYANDLLPDQTGNSGKYLTTDGGTVTWETVSAGVSIDNASLAFSNQIFS